MKDEVAPKLLDTRFRGYDGSRGTSVIPVKTGIRKSAQR